MAGVTAEPASWTRVDVLTAIVGAVGAAAVVWAHRHQPVTAVVLAVWVGVAAWLSAIDLRERRLPNRIVGPLAVAVVLTVIGAGVLTDELGRGGRALTVGAVAFVVCLAANLAGGMGMGDVKYAFPLFATVGWFGREAVAAAVLVTTLAGAVAGAAVLVMGLGRRFRLPYGPFMSLGLVAGLVVAGLGRW
jgi:leader peptidase (prepilin peptidase)/N-methyltransferase